MPIRIPVITSQTACQEVIPPLILLPFSRRKARTDYSNRIITKKILNVFFNFINF